MRDLTELNTISFPDGHKHLLVDKKDLELKEISISIKSFDDLFLLAQAKRICNNLKKLRINYLLAARCDRQFSEFEAVDLHIVANFINNLEFEEIEILKPHSHLTINAIIRSKEITVSSQLLIQCLTENNITDYSVVAPDKGAGVWIEKELGRTDIIKCAKTRVKGQVDKITIPEDAVIKADCIIVDDLCDGGATFIETSKELKIKGAVNVYLIVTHGIFSKGYLELYKHLKRIYCTNSFSDVPSLKMAGDKFDFVKQLNIKNG